MTNQQQAYDFFLASLSMEILTTQSAFDRIETDPPERRALQERIANLQRLLTALDDIFHAVPKVDA